MTRKGVDERTGSPRIRGTKGNGSHKEYLGRISKNGARERKQNGIQTNHGIKEDGRVRDSRKGHGERKNRRPGDVGHARLITCPPIMTIGNVTSPRN